MKTTNRYQENYMLARAHLETLKAQIDRIENKYIADNNIVNEDGSIPAALWMITDDAAFEIAVAATQDEIDAIDTTEAQKLLERAEDALIRYGLSIMPKHLSKEREILERHCFQNRNYTTRQKMIDTTLKLDVTTVPKAG